MLGRLFDTLMKKKTLLDEARQEAVMMLMTDQRMFDLVMVALKEEAGQHIRSRIAAMDKEINRRQRDVRKKVFEHLTISSGSDLVEGLELITAVIDLERIGDYVKNIAELVEMLPGELNFGEFEHIYDDVQELATELFGLVISAFSKNDLDAARRAMEKYDRLSLLCDGTLERLLTEGGDDSETIEKRLIGLLLMLRYLKRVGAHLKNIASILVNPFHRIGYR